jgi:hypothetical protein
MKKHIRKIILLAAVILIASIIPFSVSTVPRWRLQVVDPSGRPIANEPVGEFWEHASFEPPGHSEHNKIANTDSNGFVEFPPQSVKVTLGGIALTKFSHITSLTAYNTGKMGYVKCIKAWGDAFWFEGAPMPDKIQTVERP